MYSILKARQLIISRWNADIISAGYVVQVLQSLRVKSVLDWDNIDFTEQPKILSFASK